MTEYFSLIGDGKQAQYHKKAIESIGGVVKCIYDPCNFPMDDKEWPVYVKSLDHFFERGLADYIVICSPSHLHQEHIRLCLSKGIKVIVEKPSCMPWEPVIDDDRINICLQMRYHPDLPKKAENVYVKMVRNEEYFQTWKGDPKLTGGLFYNLFIHYIDLAIQLDANFTGHVVTDPVPQERIVDGLNLLDVDMQLLYNRMYEDIVQGGGIKPKDKYYLRWVLQRHSEIYGYGKNGLNKVIKIPRELM